MPAQPLWIERLPDLLAEVQNTAAPLWWDRPAIERLFGLRRRQAIALLHTLGAEPVGTGLVIDRSTLIRFLENPRFGHRYDEMQSRSARVTLALGEARRDRNAHRVTIPVAASPEGIDFAGLPAGIDLQVRCLTVHFETQTQLLEKLFALSQAILNDYATFETALAPSSGGDR